MKRYVLGGCFLLLAMASAAVAQNVLAQIPIASNSVGQVAVDPALNLIYDAGEFNGGGNNTTVVNGATLSVVTSFSPSGGVAVDSKTSRYWTGDLFGGDALVYSAPANTQLSSVHLGACTGEVNFDCSKRRVWVAAQCGGGNDPLWVLNADTYAVIAGPIGSGGVMGPTMLNPVTGKLYVTSGGVSEEVNPTTFAVTATSFGTVQAVDTVSDLLFASSGTNLQIVKGATDAVSKTVTLTYTPSGMGVNNALSHLYVANSAGTIEVRNETTGSLISKFSLGSNLNVGTMGVDSTRGRIYANVFNTSNGQWYLYVIEDLSNTRACRSRGSC